MTFRQTTLLAIFFVFVAFLFLLLIVHNTVIPLSTGQVEAFFLVILISLVSMAFGKKRDLFNNLTVAVGTTAGLGVYLFAKQLLTGSEIDWLTSAPIVAGASVSVLAQYAIFRIHRANSS